jgi:hypothetical protein
MWFLLMLGQQPPCRLAENVRVAHPSQSAQRSGFRWRRRSGIVRQAHEIASAVAEQVKGAHVRELVMPYEAQPLQHAINLAVKACDANVATVGYVHSALPALPTDYLFRTGAPDRLFVHGAGQREILCNLLGWPQQRLHLIASLRYRRDLEPLFAGQILLPYDFLDARTIVQAVERVLRAAPNLSMPIWRVRNHPVMAHSAKHTALAVRLKSIIDRYEDRQCPAPARAKQTIIVGATAAVIEALERGLEVVHICSRPLFEAHSESIWTYMQIDDLGYNAYRYRLREPGQYIRLGLTTDSPRESLGIAS